jgi:thymidylate synthase (FAD)
MKLIKPSYEIITPINGEEILKQIELAARTCYKSEGKIEYEDSGWNKPNEISIAKSARLLIPKLIAHGHEAMLEFGGMITVKFICDRGVSHELVRQRIASFAQESTRYCNYGKDEHIQFIIPNWSTIEECTLIGLRGSNLINKLDAVWLNHMLDSEVAYNILIKDGWSPQQARSVLPNSLKTEINVSANIREWRHIFKLRTAKAAHPQMRELMCPLLDEFKSKIPILFDDINY